MSAATYSFLPKFENNNNMQAWNRIATDFSLLFNIQTEEEWRVLRSKLAFKTLLAQRQTWIEGPLFSLIHQRRTEAFFSKYRAIHQYLDLQKWITYSDCSQIKGVKFKNKLCAGDHTCMKNQGFTIQMHREEWLTYQCSSQSSNTVIRVEDFTGDCSGQFRKRSASKDCTVGHWPQREKSPQDLPLPSTIATCLLFCPPLSCSGPERLPTQGPSRTWSQNRS